MTSDRGALKEHFLKRLKYDPAKGRQEFFDPPLYGQGTFGVRIPANVTGHSGDRDRFAHGLHAGTGFVL